MGMWWCSVHFHAFHWHSVLSMHLCFKAVPGFFWWHLEMASCRLLQGVPAHSPALASTVPQGRCVRLCSLSRRSYLPFCQQSVQHENTYRDPIAKYCYGESPPELFPAWWAQKADQAPPESLGPEATLQRSLVLLEEERHRAGASALTTSCVVVCGLALRWALPCETVL